jgi:hypothetical protein
MKFSGVAVGLATVLSVGSAQAAVVYDTLTGQTPTAAIKPSAMGDRGPLGDSFVVSSAETISSVTLDVKDATNDTGAVLVYLVPNNPATGMPALPSVSSGTTLSGATLLGTILDSSLGGSNTFTAKTLTDSVALATGTYWIEMVDANSPANGSGNPVVTNLQWGFNSDISGVGVPSSGNLASTANSTDTGLQGGITQNAGTTLNDVFALQIQTATPTPEPASLAVLSAGLLGLGLGRRRRSKKPTA